MKQRTYIKTGAILLVTGALALSTFAQQPSESKDRECTIPTYNGKELDQKPRILAKPEPKFTLAERQRHQHGVILLGAVLCGSGKVTDIEVTEGLPDGLNEKAIEAARKIQFIPAEKDGHRVSRFVTLKYLVR
ncbi:MAG: TonB family protein [Pyrinomonadaceae bacterium]|nr:TonB family protein [Pyrinomonadaceae bacterium]